MLLFLLTTECELLHNMAEEEEPIFLSQESYQELGIVRSSSLVYGVGHFVASPPPCRYLPPTGLYESTSATTPDSLAESGQPSPEEDLEYLSLPLSARASCMDWAANVLASTDELHVGQVPSFHQLYVFHGGLFAAGFCEGYSTRQDNMVRQDLRSCVVPGRVGVAVPAIFCFCGVFVLS
ncbi:hypothetical protein E2C01_035795 [Portunus trituberculatus]|uniref:Uncharacterized protein n=1 Tax=Portunus trituberculatus TaxID=210409 RepID=A0A5B7F590_PORTR|nr:hypothetical protein [Portunus trituberculatus]